MLSCHPTFDCQFVFFNELVDEWMNPPREMSGFLLAQPRTSRFTIFERCHWITYVVASQIRGCVSTPSLYAVRSKCTKIMDLFSQWERPTNTIVLWATKPQRYSQKNLLASQHVNSDGTCHKDHRSSSGRDVLGTFGNTLGTCTSIPSWSHETFWTGGQSSTGWMSWMDGSPFEWHAPPINVVSLDPSPSACQPISVHGSDTSRADRPFVDASSGARSMHRSDAVHLRTRSADCMVVHLL